MIGDNILPFQVWSQPMSIPVSCSCGNRWEVDDALAGKRILCPECDQRVAVANPGAFKVRCPNRPCGRVMTLKVPAGRETPTCRCPACTAIFFLNLPGPDPATA